jgi:hypothetical protein
MAIRFMAIYANPGARRAISHSGVGLARICYYTPPIPYVLRAGGSAAESGESAGGGRTSSEVSMMDRAQRISVVLEFDQEDEEWAVVAMLIDSKGARRRTTLARFPRREEAADSLEAMFSNLPIQMGGGA